MKYEVITNEKTVRYTHYRYIVEAESKDDIKEHIMNGDFINCDQLGKMNYDIEGDTIEIESIKPYD